VIDPTIREEETAASDRMLRGFGVLCGLLLAAIAARDLRVEGMALRVAVIGGIAILVTVAGVVRPATIRPVFVAAMTLTTPIRLLVSTVLLVIVYYIVLTPIALVARIAGRDMLSRRRRVDATTYWVPKNLPTDADSYLRPS